MPEPTHNIEAICAGISQHGYVVLENAFDQAFMQPIAAGFAALPDEAFKPAGMGRQHSQHHDHSIRGDQLVWVHEQTNGLAQYFAWCEQLRLALNRHFYLGLFEYEAMFARYPAGTRYQKHLDAFRQGGQAVNNRRISTLLYLNEQWPATAGGELQLYRPDAAAPCATVLPEWGTLVVFLSEDFPHEVLPSTQARRSLTGWFRTKA
ncbi:2OG-Fe(II) oxygenase [Marinicella meishanensis]|uniref:2OG-Fe(II) oxygenase n=1 Tax=Marinicella meishanensis TaxID=2873263 RepID=UPI001CBC53CD|nr:2OG-Fe(II) oxygenase [Marinicella sp. NBU2979]